jgi:hypothetical protein
MANPIQQAGGASEPTSFAPLHTNRIFTGLWSNRSLLRDAAVSGDAEQYGFGRQDSILGGQNSEISTRLTLLRRPGSSVYNSQTFPQITRFYSFNTFTLTDEVIRVLVDTSSTVYDATSNSATPNTKTPIWAKSAAAVGLPTFFLGVGNTLYFTNGVDNKQWVYNPTTGTGPVYTWGIAGPATAPNVSQIPRPNPYPGWAGNTGHAAWIPLSDGVHFFNYLAIVDTNNNLQVWGYELNNAPPLLQTKTGTLGTSAALPWGTALNSLTNDGTIEWQNLGNGAWASGFGYAAGQIVVAPIANPAGTPNQLFVALTNGASNLSGNPPYWPIGIGQQVSDGTSGLIWQNAGPALHWTDIGSTTVAMSVTTQPNIVDPNGYLQTVNQMGRTSASPPSTWVQETGALTTDGTVVWLNSGPFAVPGTAPVQYGYAYKNAIGDISNMSPASTPITVIQGNEVTVSGAASTDPQVTTIYIYRLPQGGSTFLYLDQIANPSSGLWTYTDNTPDSGLNILIQAQVNGEGTPLQSGATCLEYHLQRIFAAVGNVIWVSSGPDAIASTSSGNAGFVTSFTVQSKVIRFWVSSLGLVVFTVRDCYIILGSATSSDPLYITTFIDGLSLRSYDAFTTHLTTPYLMTSTNMVIALDPSAGITEASFPIADLIEGEFNPASCYVTYHTESSRDHALYVADGSTGWYRLSATTAPESGASWSTKANLVGSHSAVQSIEITPGTNRLLIGPGAAGGQIWFRDQTVNTDDGTPYPANTTFGSIVLAQPGQLAALAFITLESILTGTKPSLSILMGEISGTFEALNRTRQDPPNLPPSATLYSDRYHFMQSQIPAWCRHFQMDIAWPAEDAANELLTFTIFGQTWNEYRSQ